MKRAFIWYLLLIAFISTGCAARLVLGNLTRAEIAALGSRTALLSRNGLAVRGTQLAVTDETIFLSRLRRVKIESKPVSKGARLYTVENNGSKTYFGRPSSANTIQLIDLERTISLPAGSRIFRVKNSANVRVGPGKHYELFKFEDADFLTKDQVVLVLEKVDDWYKVQIAKEIVGYVFESLLEELFFEGRQFSNVKKDERCDICQGNGHVVKNTNCNLCKGSGSTLCIDCKGKANFTCSSCEGNGRFICTECKGKTQHACSGCGTAGYLKCNKCKGRGLILDRSGLSQCSQCYGNGKVSCNRCYQAGYIPCNRCYQAGYITCNRCYQSGSLPCNRCYQSGKLTCTNCNGNRQINQKFQCSKCDGQGYFSLDVFKEMGIMPSKQVFYETFDNNVNRWVILNTDNLSTYFNQEKYIIENRVSNNFISVIRPTTDFGNDYAISVSTIHRNGVIDFGYGLVFSFKDYNNYYSFLIAEGYYKLFRIVNGTYEEIIPWTRTEYIKRGASINRLKIHRSGSNCWIYVNDVYINKFYGFVELGNALGFFIDNNQAIEFDDLRISQ